jgi:hypothetical protein
VDILIHGTRAFLLVEVCRPKSRQFPPLMLPGRKFVVSMIEEAYDALAKD